MNTHLFLPGIELSSLNLLPEHREWLIAWLKQVEAGVEYGDICSSACLQGVISELALYGDLHTDWCGILDEYLTLNEQPIAYSEVYGKRLYKFADWQQTPIHCLHTRWWIEQKCSKPSTIAFADRIQSFIQPNGWIYNPAVSPTGLRTRMKTEYMLSMAMGLEILNQESRLLTYRQRFEATLSAEPRTPYLSAECFRVHALKTLTSTKLAPVGLEAVLSQGETEHGYCDFSVSVKVDDYMGTAKRTSRDKPVHSALAALHAQAVSSLCSPEVQSAVAARLHHFGEYLRLHPLDIPAFRIRDVDIPFGTDLSPLEVIAASALVSGVSHGGTKA